MDFALHRTNSALPKPQNPFLDSLPAAFIIRASSVFGPLEIENEK
jgi:hypothetical protein